MSEIEQYSILYNNYFCIIYTVHRMLIIYSELHLYVFIK